MEKVRNYSSILHRVHSMNHITVSNIGSVREHPSTPGNKSMYPILKMTAGAKNAPSVFISGGVHGNEPAGAYAVVEFFEKHVQKYADDFHFWGIPVVNPWGFERNCMQDADGTNINRMFTPKATLGLRPLPPQVYLIKKALVGERFIFSIDHHEDYYGWEEKGMETEKDVQLGFYMYETRFDGGQRMGRKMADAVLSLEGVTAFSGSDRRYGDVVENGLIPYPENCSNPVYAKGTSLDSYLVQNHTQHSFTIETPNTWPMERRIAAQITALTTALDSSY